MQDSANLRSLTATPHALPFTPSRESQTTLLKLSGILVAILYFLIQSMTWSQQIIGPVTLDDKEAICHAINSILPGFIAFPNPAQTGVSAIHALLQAKQDGQLTLAYSDTDWAQTYWNMTPPCITIGPRMSKSLGLSGHPTPVTNPTFGRPEWALTALVHEGWHLYELVGRQIQCSTYADILGGGLSENREWLAKRYLKALWMDGDELDAVLAQACTFESVISSGLGIIGGIYPYDDYEAIQNTLETIVRHTEIYGSRSSNAAEGIQSLSAAHPGDSILQNALHRSQESMVGINDIVDELNSKIQKIRMLTGI